MWVRNQAIHSVNALILSMLLCPSLFGQTGTEGTHLQTEPAGVSAMLVDPDGQTTDVSGANSLPKKSAHFPAVLPAGRQTIGLVLEGGGALGLAHIGVLEWFEENRIPVDRMAGTSMGALVGGLYASGESVSEIQQIATGSALTDVFLFQDAHENLNFRRRQDQREFPHGTTLGLKGGVRFRNALLTDSGLNTFLYASFATQNRNDTDFDQMPIPFRCVATDLNTLESVVFESGPLPQAIRATISIPGIFSPVIYRGHYLIDGAITNNLPTDVMKKDLNADVVIAVHLQSSDFSESDVDSLLGIFTRALFAGSTRSEREGQKLADILLTARTDTFSTMDYDKADKLIQLGHQAAEAQRSQLMKYQLSEADWNIYLADRRSRIRSLPAAYKAVEIAGGSPEARADAERTFKSVENKPADPDKIVKAIQRVQANGTYSASVEDFAISQSARTDKTVAQTPDSGLQVNLSETRNGPPFLMIGFDLIAATSNVTRSSFDTRFIFQNLGGFGSELRTDARLGFQTQLSTEYYRLLTYNGLFIQPHAGIDREPVYLWENQRRVSEWFEQLAGGGIDFGRTFNRHSQLSAQWGMQTIRWNLRSGATDSTPVSGTVQSATLHYSYDSAVASTISPGGWRVDAIAGAQFNTVASENAPLVRLNIAKSFTFGEQNILAFRTEMNSYFRRNVADPLRFTLGGPLRLSASSIDEYRGTDNYLVRAIYLRQIAALPVGIRQRIYAAAGYEAGEIWSPEQPVIFRQDGVLGMGVVTPLGVITLGTSVGDASRRKVFFTMGRIF